VTSVHRNNRYIVAVVLGGASAGERDARMRALIETHIASASTKHTATAIAQAAGAKTEKRAAEAKAEARPAKSIPTYTVASIAPLAASRHPSIPTNPFSSCGTSLSPTWLRLAPSGSSMRRLSGVANKPIENWVGTKH
jgi:D-alanyl-D-alanine carboxypeptidase